MNKLFILREERNLQALWTFLGNNWKPCAEDGKPLSVSIAHEKAKRGNQQNRLYHALLRQISDQAWIEGKQYAPEIWHEAAKRRFIGFADVPGGGTVGLSSTDLSVAEFAEFVTEVQAWANTELGVQFVETS